MFVWGGFLIFVRPGEAVHEPIKHVNRDSEKLEPPPPEFDDNAKL